MLPFLILLSGMLANSLFYYFNLLRSLAVRSCSWPTTSTDRAKVAVALELQMQRHEEQLRLMCRLFTEQLAAIREVVRN